MIMKTFKKNRLLTAEDSQSRKSHTLSYHQKCRLTFPFHVVKFSKSVHSHPQQHHRKKQSFSLQKRTVSASLDKNKQNRSRKKLLYLKNTATTAFSLENTKKNQIMKKQKNKESKKNLKINQIPHKTLKIIKENCSKNALQIRQSQNYPMDTRDQVIRNLQALRKCLQKSKQNKYYGPLIAQTSQKYEDIIQFMIKDNLNLNNRSVNNFENQKQSTSLKDMTNSQNKNINLIQKPKIRGIQNKLGLDLSDLRNQGISNYQDQFMSKADQFSQSWTQLIQKQRRF